MYKSIDLQDSCTYTILIVQVIHTKEVIKLKNYRLIKARKQKGLNQADLAHILGFKGKQSVANWENGHSTPTLSTAILIAEILNKDVVYLFGNQVQDSQTLKKSKNDKVS